MTNIAGPVSEEDLQAWVDNRLSPERADAVRDYLARHPEERERLSQYAEHRRVLRAAFRRSLEPVPRHLSVARLIRSKRHRRRNLLLRLAAAVVLVIFSGAAGWFAHEISGPLSRPFTAERILSADALAAHQTFAVEIRHPVEVPAAQQAHLGQWLTNRLGRPLVIPDLTPFGLQLMGGRVLPSNAGPAAQLMYNDASGNRFTVYIRVGVSGETRHFERHDNISLLLWIDEGFGYALVGNADRDLLTGVAESVYEQFLPNSPKGEISGGKKAR